MIISKDSVGSMVDVPTATPKLEESSPTSESEKLLPTSDAMATAIRKAESKSGVILQAKPFFIMDWLENVDPQDVELAREMLQTPNKSGPSMGDDSDKLQVLKKDLFPPSPCSVAEKVAATPPRAKASSPIFLKRSIAIGNGWNAKGLEKAKNGSWEKAISCWENTLEIRQQVLGDDHPDVANTYNNMGIALGKLNRFDDALDALHSALDIRCRHYGEEHEEVAATLHNMANVYQQAGDLDTAIQYFYDSKSLQERILGEDHVHVARAYVAIGHTYFEAQNYEQAADAYHEALDIFARSDVANHDGEIESIYDDLKEIEDILMGNK